MTALAPCAECGFDPDSVTPADVPAALSTTAERFALALEQADAGVRTREGVWSTAEYGQHVADVIEVMTDRMKAIRDAEGGEVTFDDWDQDAAAVEKEYDQANTHVTAILVKERAAGAAEEWAALDRSAWEWTGRRSDGTELSITGWAAYLLHELHHHLGDVNA